MSRSLWGMRKFLSYVVIWRNITEQKLVLNDPFAKDAEGNS